jgi:hypothetical protein
MNQHVKKITDLNKNYINVYTETLLPKFGGTDSCYNVSGRGASRDDLLLVFHVTLFFQVSSVLHICVFWLQQLFNTEPHLNP